MKKRFKRIYIEITNACNLNCSFCPPTKRTKEYMNINDFKHILNEIKPFSDYVYLHVKGEPLMHSNLGEILSLCNESGIMVNITTNGTLIVDSKELLINGNVRQINISLHNDNEDIENTILAAKEIANKANTIIQFRLWNLKSNQNNLNTIKMLENIFNIELKDEKEKISYKLADNIFLNFDYQFEWPDITKSKMNTIGSCEGLKTQIGILVDGTVVPCCLDNDGDIPLGNLFDEDLEGILNKDRTKRIIEGFKNKRLVEPLCQKCNYTNK